ncbi:phospholipase D-like domain-containing protein, partial [Mycoplasmopsis synoviae]|uniref:phospholipase D-like domain-containing protein n=1 Tax=Mycoplasmopsis synoviae TaxID=2109 RepID=UPI00387B9039
MAKYNIKIVTPYFSVTKTLFNQIVLTLKSGIDVEIYIPGLHDKKIPYEVSLNELFKLKEYGLKIYIYSDHFV